ncbi:MAG: ribonuclease Y [Candidatus Eisenbacteria bacterium]|nr:ribonuclease Y [Candidatus Eisenbacteria bacterium]
MGTELWVVIIVFLVAVGVFLAGWFARRLVDRSKIVSAEELAEKIVREAEREAETQKKAAVLEAKDEWYKAKAKFEEDTQQTRQEVEKLQRQVEKREENLERKLEFIEKKETELDKLESDLGKQETSLKDRSENLSKLLEEQNERLERIAGMNRDDAKKLLIRNMESDARLEAARMIKDIRDDARRTADKEAKQVLTMAIQRCAADHVVESTVSVVNLPNDEMKGRIIGREGRNIRAFETATGIDVIVDDTPEAVILSGFDPVRREIARLSLERLITDGRIHPGRIEEVVEKVRKELDEQIVELGEEACLDVGIHDLKPEMIKLLGRLRYRTSYGQNMLQHSKEVAYLCGLMAGELEFDATMAKRAGLLHDIGKAVDHSMEGTHAALGAELARRYGEDEIVVNSIESHHEDVEPQSMIAVLVQAADAVSGARPGARRETLETYIKRLEKLEDIASSFQGVERSYAIQAGREIRIMVQHKKIDDARAEVLAQAVARKIEAELKYPGQIKVVVIRETRSVDYAK